MDIESGTEENNSEIIHSDDFFPVNTNIETPHLEDTIAEESILTAIHQNLTSIEPVQNSTLAPKKTVKRGAPSRHNTRKRSPSKRRRLTTTPDYYYDSYEDGTTTNRYRSKNRQKPKRPVDSYEDEYDYNYEFTTRPYKKRRRTTLNPRNRNKSRRKQQRATTVASDYNDDYDYDPVTQIVILRQRQTVTPTDTVITSGVTTESSTSTTTDSSTTTTETTTTTTNSTNTTGYGKYNKLHCLVYSLAELYYHQEVNLKTILFSLRLWSFQWQRRDKHHLWPTARCTPRILWPSTSFLWTS